MSNLISVKDVLGIYEETLMKRLEELKNLELIEICTQAWEHIDGQESDTKACFKEHLEGICNHLRQHTANHRSET